MPEGQHRYAISMFIVNYRLYVRGKHVSYTRGKRNTSPNTSLIKIEGCDNIKHAEFYLGKRIAYVYRVFSLLTPYADDIGTTGNPGKQNPCDLGEGDKDSWEQWRRKG